MKILSLNNNHKEEEQKNFGYRSICPNCGTIFTFEEVDIHKPKMPCPDLRDCYIICPNKDCCWLMPMDDSCIHAFKSIDERYEFEKEL